MNTTENLALLTDLYELTMIQGYYFSDPHKKAVFDMFFRTRPFSGGFTVFAGLGPLIDAIVDLKFRKEDLEYLDSLKIFRKEFLDYLKNFRFTGDIYSLREGSIVFPNEPLLRVHASLIEAQFLESIILNFINFQSLIATKAARITIASGGGTILEFGLRRAQGINGAVYASRAAYIGGVSATSNVLAGGIYGIPVAGTMAHSWVMSFDTELEAFEKYAAMYPDNAVLLVDTFDSLRSGVPNAVKVFKKLKESGIKKFGIRLDSGDLEYISKEARKIFDYNGLPEAKIYASNDLDEWIINQLLKSNAPIDAWGVGTRLVTGDKGPAMTGVYKITARQSEKDFIPCIKISNNIEKTTNPGIKNICRFYDEKNCMIADLVFLENEKEELFRKINNQEPVRFNHPGIDSSYFILSDYSYVKELLYSVINNGEKVNSEKIDEHHARSNSLEEIQEFTKRELESLDSTHKRLLNPHLYKISLSDNAVKLKRDLIKENRSE